MIPSSSSVSSWPSSISSSSTSSSIDQGGDPDPKEVEQPNARARLGEDRRPSASLSDQPYEVHPLHAQEISHGNIRRGNPSTQGNQRHLEEEKNTMK